MHNPPQNNRTQAQIPQTFLVFYSVCLYQQSFTENQINDVNIHNLSLTRFDFKPQVHTQTQQSQEGLHGRRDSSWLSFPLGRGINFRDCTFLTKEEHDHQTHIWCICQGDILYNCKIINRYIGWFCTFKLQLQPTLPDPSLSTPSKEISECGSKA